MAAHSALTVRTGMKCNSSVYLLSESTDVLVRPAGLDVPVDCSSDVTADDLVGAVSADARLGCLRSALPRSSLLPTVSPSRHQIGRLPPPPINVGLSSAGHVTVNKRHNSDNRS